MRNSETESECEVENSQVRMFGVQNIQQRQRSGRVWFRAIIAFICICSNILGIIGGLETIVAYVLKQDEIFLHVIPHYTSIFHYLFESNLNESINNVVKSIADFVSLNQ